MGWVVAVGNLNDRWFVEAWGHVDESSNGSSVRRIWREVRLDKGVSLLSGERTCFPSRQYPMIPSFCASLSALTLSETMHNDSPFRGPRPRKPLDPRQSQSPHNTPGQEALYRYREGRTVRIGICYNQGLRASRRHDPKPPRCEAHNQRLVYCGLSMPPCIVPQSEHGQGTGHQTHDGTIVKLYWPHLVGNPRSRDFVGMRS
jgi:hypothetical protein